MSGPIYLPRFGEGGPTIWKGKDRAFFFFGYEVQRQLFDAGIKTGIVPTLKQREGDYSEFLPGGIYGNASGANLYQAGAVTIPGLLGSVPNAGGIAPNNNLTPYVDPVGKVLLGLFPLPNFTPAADKNYNYFASVVQPINRIDAKARFDFKISDKHSAYLRLARESELQSSAFGLNNTSTFELPSQTQGTNRGQSASLNVTSVFNPTMTNELVVSASQLNLNYNYAASERVNLDALGIGNLQLPFGKQTNAPPAIYSWGQKPVWESLWSGISNPILSVNESFSVTDNLTKVAGSHTFKFGGLIEQINNTRNTQDDAAGALVIGGPWNQNATRTISAIYSSAGPSRFSTRPCRPPPTSAPTISKALRKTPGRYAPISPWSTMRVAYFPNIYERNGLGTLFDPSKYVRGAGPTSTTIWTIRTRCFPLGKARSRKAFCQITLRFSRLVSVLLGIGGTGDFVIRGGAGLFYNRLAGINIINPTLFGPPFGQRKAVINAFDGAQFFSDNVNDLSLNRLPLLDFSKRVGIFQIDSPDPDSNTTPRSATMSLSVAKRLPFGNILEVGYVSTLGRHLFNFKRINVIQPGTLLNGSITDPGDATQGRPAAQLDLSNPIQRSALDALTLNRFRPYPDLEVIRLIQNTSTSAYHSLQATLSRQLGKNLQYFATYTFSKVLGTQTPSGEVDPIDTRGRSYGVLDFDRTHIFNVSYNYLPNGARGFLDNAVTRGVFNGWQMSGITTFQSGTPIVLRFTGGGINDPTTSLAYFGTDAFNGSSGVAGGIAPLFSRNPKIENNGGLNERIFDISAISIPSLGESGSTISPFYIRGPNRWNHDITFFKNFALSGDGARRIQFRAGFFNIFNQAYASGINLALDTDCVARVDGIRNGSGGLANGLCDPTAGFQFTQNTLDNFGKIQTKRGRRIVELVIKFYF
ncbi:MAG: hypothetical protein WKF30_06820 [Pyrinomonadaceae bacterium]